MKKIILIVFSLLLSLFLYGEQYDPMMPAGYANKTALLPSKQVKNTYKRLFLRQIVMSKKGNRAVINGDVLQEGNYIDHAKIIKIEANKVTLSRSGKQWVMQLDGDVTQVRR